MNLQRAIPYSIFIFSLFFSYSISAQTEPSFYKLFVNLEKAPFDSLYILDYTEDRRVFISGKQTKEFYWEFNIPADIVKDSENMILLSKPYDSVSNSQEMVRFVTDKALEKVIIANIGVNETENYIYGTYTDSTHFSNHPLFVKSDTKDSVTVGNLIALDFDLIIKDQNSDIAVRAEDPYFSWFLGVDNDSQYQSAVTSYIDLSRKYPNSRFLVSSLSRMLSRYKSKEDVKRIYINLSDEHKNTIWAKNIERFLSQEKFQNSTLPTAVENNQESIIQDFSKHNLVIFSASWCAPCIEEIPTLKKIFKDLGKDLILTYVSIDDLRSVTSFKELIKSNNIPWRSVFAYANVKKIKQKYFIEGIPHNILIYPNRDMEKIDIRKQEEISRLYSLINGL